MDHTLESGAKLSITVAPFAIAHDLLKSIMRACQGLDMANVDIPNSVGDIQNINAMIDKVLSIATSEEVEKNLFKCLERCSYDDVKITRALFDDPGFGAKLREDYYTVCYKVIEENCKPFLVRTFSGLRATLSIQQSNHK